MFVPDKLKIIRKERKLTQAELAKKANMGVNSITRYEKGQRTPPIEETLKIAKALDIKPEGDDKLVSKIMSIEVVLNSDDTINSITFARRQYYSDK